LGCFARYQKFPKESKRTQILRIEANADVDFSVYLRSLRFEEFQRIRILWVFPVASKKQTIPNLDIFGAILVEMVIEFLSGGFEVCLGVGGPLAQQTVKMLAATGAPLPLI